ncbi:MAG: AIR carboxylase family protein, partial [archaeon]|nr:AIR carboxylase family protein [archaeon]
ILIIAVAGGTDALSGIASFHSSNPVISCPPDKEEYESCLKNPPGSSNALILRPANAARFTAQYFSFINKDIRKSFEKSKLSKISSLKEADEKAQNKSLF